MKYYIGIDLGGTNVRTLLVDENGESYSEVKGPTECGNGPDYVCDKGRPFTKPTLRALAASQLRFVL